MAMKNFFYKYGIGIILGLGSLLISNASISYANNLSISNVSLETRDSTLNTAVVEFDISWDNSWRNAENHDAVWIVAKEILLNSSEPYHFPMYTSGLDHQ